MKITPEQVEAAMLHLLAEARESYPGISSLTIHASHYPHIKGSVPYIRWEGHGTGNACVVDGQNIADCVSRLAAQMESPLDQARKLREEAARLNRVADELAKEAGK